MRDRLRTCSRPQLLGPAAAVAVWVACLVARPGVFAQEKQPGKPTDEKAELAEFLDDARHYTIRATKPEAVLKLHEPPVLNFTNPELVMRVTAYCQRAAAPSFARASISTKISGSVPWTRVNSPPAPTPSFGAA